MPLRNGGFPQLGVLLFDEARSWLLVGSQPVLVFHADHPTTNLLSSRGQVPLPIGSTAVEALRLNETHVGIWVVWNTSNTAEVPSLWVYRWETLLSTASSGASGHPVVMSTWWHNAVHRTPNGEVQSTGGSSMATDNPVTWYLSSSGCWLTAAISDVLLLCPNGTRRSRSVEGTVSWVSFVNRSIVVSVANDTAGWFVLLLDSSFLRIERRLIECEVTGCAVQCAAPTFCIGRNDSSDVHCMAVCNEGTTVLVAPLVGTDGAAKTRLAIPGVRRVCYAGADGLFGVITTEGPSGNGVWLYDMTTMELLSYGSLAPATSIDTFSIIQIRVVSETRTLWVSVGSGNHGRCAGCEFIRYSRSVPICG